MYDYTLVSCKQVLYLDLSQGLFPPIHRSPSLSAKFKAKLVQLLANKSHGAHLSRVLCMCVVCSVWGVCIMGGGGRAIVLYSLFHGLYHEIRPSN